MTAIIHDGNGHSPVVFQSFSFSGGGNDFDICGFEEVFGFHGQQI
jgi:hypothetical protein